MARPRKVGLDYFSHDVDASADDKLRAMELKFGPAGYALYFKCLERIYRTDKPIEYPGVFRSIMALQLRIGEDNLDEMLKYAFLIRLLKENEDGSIGSEGAEKRRNHIEKERESDRNRRPGSIPADNGGDPAQRKGNKIKGNKTKDQDLVGDAPATAQQILDYLNLKAGKSYRMGKAHKTLIDARFNEGYSLDEFRKVIDNKVADWGTDAQMEQYLRPATLFQASKFDGYLNQKSAGPKPPRSQGNGFRRPNDDDQPDLDFLPTGTDA